MALSAYATRHTVQVGNNFYSPAQLTINQGDTVRFQWVGGNHPTASDNNAFPMFSMNSASQTQDLVLLAGNYPYHCVAHGAAGGIGMAGRIVVSVVNAAPAFVKANAEVSVYPNPASEQITISHNIQHVDAIKLTNMIGQQVKFVKPAFGGSDQVQINIADLPKGIYFVNLQQNGTTVFTRRMVKDR